MAELNPLVAPSAPLPPVLSGFRSSTPPRAQSGVSALSRTPPKIPPGLGAGRNSRRSSGGGSGNTGSSWTSRLRTVPAVLPIGGDAVASVKAPPTAAQGEGSPSRYAERPRSRSRSSTTRLELSLLDATAEQSAKVSDEMLKSAINRIASIPDAAKADAERLVPVLRQHLKRVEHPPAAHRLLFQQGDASNNVMFFIAKGTLEVLEGTKVVGLLDAGRSLGEVCIGNPNAGKRTATVRAQSDGLELLTLNTEAFRQALHSVQAAFVGSGGEHVEPEEPLPDDEWDWCLSFGCETGHRKLPGASSAVKGLAGIGQTPPQPVTLQLPCAWNQWPSDGFTLPDSCAFIGTGTLSLSTDNWCELKGKGTEFTSEVQPNDTIVVRVTSDGKPVGSNELAVAHTFTVHAVMDDCTLQVTRPVKPGLQIPRVEFQIRRTVDTWSEPQWQAQGEWEASTFEERSHVRTKGAVAPVEVKLLDDDPFFRLLDTYMHRPWLCPVHTLKLGFLRAGLEVRERLSSQYDVLFLMVRARDELLERTADSLRATGEGFLRNLVYANDDETSPDDDEQQDEHSAHESLGRSGDDSPSQKTSVPKQLSSSKRKKQSKQLAGDSRTLQVDGLRDQFEDRGVLQEFFHTYGQVTAVTVRKRQDASWGLVTFLDAEVALRVLQEADDIASKSSLTVQKFDWEVALQSTGAMTEIAQAHRVALKQQLRQKGGLEQHVKSLSHGHSSTGNVSASPAGSAGDYRWGHVLGMVRFPIFVCTEPLIDPFDAAT